MANFSKPQNMTTMLFAFFAFLQFTVAFQHGTHHQHARHSADMVIKSQIDDIADSLAARQSSGFIAITGVCSNQDSNGACDSNGRVSAPRLELRQLKQNADQWNLYLLGMERFMAKDKNDRLSYYQVVGVHGRPFTTWNNFPTPLVNQAGFCPHAQTLFGAWHRPYLAIFEVDNLRHVLSLYANNIHSKPGIRAFRRSSKLSPPASRADGTTLQPLCACPTGTGRRTPVPVALPFLLRCASRQ